MSNILSHGVRRLLIVQLQQDTLYLYRCKQSFWPDWLTEKVEFPVCHVHMKKKTLMALLHSVSCTTGLHVRYLAISSTYNSQWNTIVSSYRTDGEFNFIVKQCESKPEYQTVSHVQLQAAEPTLCTLIAAGFVILFAFHWHQPKLPQAQVQSLEAT